MLAPAGTGPALPLQGQPPRFAVAAQRPQQQGPGPRDWQILRRGGGCALALLASRPLRQKQPRSRAPAVARRGFAKARLVGARPETAIATPMEGYQPDTPKGGTKFLSGFRDLVKHYDAFTLDQYGVLHDGAEAFEGVKECMKEIHDAGKRVVILSNFAGRADVGLQKLPRLGLDPEHVDGFLTSGELVHTYIKKYASKFGNNVMWIASKDLQKGGLADFWSELGDFNLVSEASKANFILVSGVGCLFAGTDSAQEMDYEESGNSIPFEIHFRRAIHNTNIPMLCANPDLTVMRPGGATAFMPGSLAETYKHLGGRVIYFGKPNASSFDEARRLLEDDLDAGRRFCHVGDSLHHDVSGAKGAGFDTLFITRTGIHAKDLPDDLVERKDLWQLCVKNTCPMPNAVLPDFRW